MKKKWRTWISNWLENCLCLIYGISDWRYHWLKNFYRANIVSFFFKLRLCNKTSPHSDPFVPSKTAYPKIPFSTFRFTWHFLYQQTLWISSLSNGPGCLMYKKKTKTRLQTNTCRPKGLQVSQLQMERQLLFRSCFTIRAEVCNHGLSACDNSHILHV